MYEYLTIKHSRNKNDNNHLNKNHHKYGNQAQAHTVKVCLFGTNEE
jgi:hypothetical protein